MLVERGLASCAYRKLGLFRAVGAAEVDRSRAGVYAGLGGTRQRGRWVSHLGIDADAVSLRSRLILRCRIGRELPVHQP